MYIEMIFDQNRINRLVEAFKNHQRRPHPSSVLRGILLNKDGDTFAKVYLQDGKVYLVLADAICVLEYSEFLAQTKECFIYVPYATMPYTTKRLVFSKDELDCKGYGCNERDQFVIGGKYQIVVTRTGYVTDHYTDGRLLSPRDQKWAQDIDEYYNNDTGEVVDQWRDAEVYEDGTIRSISDKEIHPVIPEPSWLPFDWQRSLGNSTEAAPHASVWTMNGDVVKDQLAVVKFPNDDLAERSQVVAAFISMSLNAFMRTPEGQKEWENVNKLLKRLSDTKKPSASLPCQTCGRQVPPSIMDGDSCPNCGFVFPH
jgi:hypothetical protein